MRITQVTVCYLLAHDPERGEVVLLGEKRTGLGLGKVVAPGGKLEAGESPADACVREVAEESGLEVRPEHLVPAGGPALPVPESPELGSGLARVRHPSIHR